MNRREKAIFSRLVDYIRERRHSEPEKLDIFATLQELRGRGCADHAMTLIRAYANSANNDLTDLEGECKRLFTIHQRANQITWQVRLCIASFYGMVVVVLGLIVLAIAGHTIPKDERYLVSLLMGMLVAALIIGGTSTAAVSAAMPGGKGMKMAIKLGGAGAGAVGTCVIFHWIGY